MSRSTYIYVVQAKQSSWTDEGELIAAFTVKHELCSWLYWRYDKNITVKRTEDGPVTGNASKTADMELTPLIQQGYEQMRSRWERTAPQFRTKEPPPPPAT